jgi:hypothetical protein
MHLNRQARFSLLAFFQTPRGMALRERPQRVILNEFFGMTDCIVGNELTLGGIELCPRPYTDEPMNPRTRHNTT